MTGNRLVEWDRLEFRVRGERIVPLVRNEIAARRLPLEIDRIAFAAGDLEVTGRVRKGIPVPFRFHLRRIEANGTTVRIPIEDLTVLGFLPVPGLLFRIAESVADVEGVLIDAGTKSILVSVDRFLPPFVDAAIAAVRIVPEGILVTLAGGGADIPTPPGDPR